MVNIVVIAAVAMALACLMMRYFPVVRSMCSGLREAPMGTGEPADLGIASILEVSEGYADYTKREQDWSARKTVIYDGSASRQCLSNACHCKFAVRVG